MADDSEKTTSARAMDLIRTFDAEMSGSIHPWNLSQQQQALSLIIRTLEEQASPVYEERNRILALTCFLASQMPGWKLGLGRHEARPGETWDPAWAFIVFLEWTDPKQESFKFQASWHIHQSQVHLFAFLPPYDGKWDGHTSQQKYKNIELFIK